MNIIDYDKIAYANGWKKSDSNSDWSWEKSIGNTLQGHFKVDYITGKPLKMSAKELCEKEHLIQ